MKTGYATIIPVIKKLRFSTGKIHVILEDEREIIVPLSRFPEIENLTTAQRSEYQILDGIGIAFKDLDETFHISQFLGEENKIFDVPVTEK